MVIQLPSEPAAALTMVEDTPNLQIGDHVLVKEDNPLPLH
jgi:hypothetical protein